MTAVFRLESKKRVRSSVLLLIVFALLATLYFSIFPGIQTEMDALEDAFPEPMFVMFGIEELHTIEGFIAAEIYSFFWVLLVASYFSYIGAGLIAGDRQKRRLDLTLAGPLSRESLLLQKVGALWVPLVVLNVGVSSIVYTGALIIGEAFNPVAIVMVHLLSIPYLLVCSGIGIIISVSLENVRTARATAVALVFVLWLVEGVSRLDDTVEWVGAVAPSRYYDETAILVHETYAFFDATLLLVVFFVLVGISLLVFTRKDIN